MLVPPGEPKPVNFSDVPLWYKALIYADSGVGKTRLCATAPGDILYLQVDNSVESARRNPKLKFLPPYVPEHIETWRQAVDTIAFISTYHEYLHSLGFNSVVLDTGTMLAQHCARHILGEQGPTGRVHPNVLSKADYGVLGALLLEQLRILLAAPFHVIVNAQSKDVEVESTEEGKLKEHWKIPQWKGRMTGDETPQMFSLIGYLGTMTDDQYLVHRKLLVQPLQNHAGKIRLPEGVNAITLVDNPNLETIFRYMSGEIPNMDGATEVAKEFASEWQAEVVPPDEDTEVDGESAASIL